MSFTTIPEGISGDPGDTVNLVGIATAEFIGAGATTINDGNVVYQWYEVGIGELSDGNRLSGTSTNTLTISNLQSPGDSNRKFYLEAKYQSTAYKNRLDGKNGNHITPAVSDPAAADVSRPLPTASISASSGSIGYNGSVTISWSTTNANTLTSNFGDTRLNGSRTFRNQTSSRTFRITATNETGSRSASTFVSVASPITPSINLSLSPSSILYNGSTTLTWSSTNATSVVSSNFGATDVNGSITLTNQTQSRTFSITVRSADGVQRTESVSLSVASQIIPTITLTASPSSIISGESTTLTWSSTNATSVVSSNFGATDVNGSTVRTNQTQSTNYNITVASADGTQRTANASLTVDSIPLPTATISASPSSVDYNGSTTVTWSTSNATSLSSNFGETALSGSKTFTNLTQDDVYTITATNTSGSVSASANVSVGAPPKTLLTLNASPESIGNGGSTTLTWSTTNATSLSSNFGVTALSGSTTLSGLVETKEYEATATGPGGSITKRVIVAVAAPVPIIVITSQPSPVSATFNKCSGGGGSVNFSVGASVNNPTGATLSYQWYLNGSALSNSANVSGAQSSTLTLRVLENQSGNNTVYVRVSYSGATTVQSNNAPYSVTVIEPRPSLSITSQPTNQTVFVGETATFSVRGSISDGRAVGYQWFLSNGQRISGATESVYQVTPTSAGTQSFYVEVFDRQSTCISVPPLIESNSVTLTAKEISNIIKVGRRDDDATSINYADVDLDVFTFTNIGSWEVYSPFRDIEVDVKIEAAAGRTIGGPGGGPGGKGGQAVVRFTLKQNNEYIIKTLGDGPGGGGGGVFIYDKARLIACVGGGGGAGLAGGGGDGGGVGQNGQGGKGGTGGGGGFGGAADLGFFPGGDSFCNVDPDAGKFDRSKASGGRVSKCTIGDPACLGPGFWQNNYNPCDNYGNSVSALNTNGSPVSGSALISRGFKGGIAHRNNGGSPPTAQLGREGGGGSGAAGGGAANGSGTRALKNSGGGGASGYNGGVTVIQNRSGGRTARNGQFTIAVAGRGLRL
jgi:hypothetical protein